MNNVNQVNGYKMKEKQTVCYNVTDANCVKMSKGDSLTQYAMDIAARLAYLEQPYLHYVDEMKKHGTI